MKSIKINTYPLKLREKEGQKQVFDPVRKKFVAFTPEEFVRQNIIMHLIETKNYKKNLMAIEYPLKHLDTVLRSDIVVFNRRMKARIIVECKAPSVKITQKTIEQAAHYNSKLNVEYLLLSNGNNTSCCKINYENKSFVFLEEIPDFGVIDP